MKQLKSIIDIRAKLEVLTGLHIGAGDMEMRIGGVDNPVVKHPITQDPYIPGSSLKGKIRSLLEWRSGEVKEGPLGYKDYKDASGESKALVGKIIRLFGMSGGDSNEAPPGDDFGPTRVSFSDCHLEENFAKDIREKSNYSFFEVKSENSINRISGTAQNPRHTERVPAGTIFEFRVTIRQFKDDQDLVGLLFEGMKLLELDSLGKSGSRGYGKVRFTNITINGEAADDYYAKVKPFAEAV